MSKYCKALQLKPSHIIRHSDLALSRKKTQVPFFHGKDFIEKGVDASPNNEDVQFFLKTTFFLDTQKAH